MRNQLNFVSLFTQRVNSLIWIANESALRTIILEAGYGHLEKLEKMNITEGSGGVIIEGNVTTKNIINFFLASTDWLTRSARFIIIHS